MSKIREFKDFIAKRNPKSFVFWSENQDSYRAADPCKLQLTFTNMLISENPSVIYLTCGENSMRLDRVKNVEYSDNITPLGTIIRIYCGNSVVGRQEFCYSLIAI